jgi:hypothetical protein
VAIHTTKYQTVTYLPPTTTNTRFVDLTTSKEISTVRFNEYNQTDQMYYKASANSYAINLPLHIGVKSSVQSIDIKIVFKFTFRGEKFEEKLNKMIYLYHKNEQFKSLVDKECDNLELVQIKKIKEEEEEDPWDADPEEDELKPGELDNIKRNPKKEKKKK